MYYSIAIFIGLMYYSTAIAVCSAGTAPLRRPELPFKHRCGGIWAIQLVVYNIKLIFAFQ